VNDTPRWLLLRTFVGSSSLVVNLYGRPVDRRVETETAPLRITGPAPVTRVPDPRLLVGQSVVEDAGEPARATSVRRRVYTEDGTLLYDDVWSSSYRGEKRVVRVGTKKPPEPSATTPTTTTPKDEPKPKPKAPVPPPEPPAPVTP
jgi:surface rod structure-forming protein G